MTVGGVGKVILEKSHQNKNFSLFNEIRQAKLKMSKEQLGNGLRANQSAAIHPQEIDYLFKSGAINLASGLGILRCLYIFFVIAGRLSSKTNTWPISNTEC